MPGSKLPAAAHAFENPVDCRCLKVTDRTVRHMQTHSEFQPFRRAVTDTRTAENGGCCLYGNKGPRGNASFRLHQHPEGADVESLGTEDAVTLTILPAKMNLAVDGKALMQPFVGPLFFGNRTCLCWNRLLFAQLPTPAGQQTSPCAAALAQKRHGYGDSHRSRRSTYLWIFTVRNTCSC